MPPALYLRLMELGAEAEAWESVLESAERLLGVNPLQPAPHRFLALAAESVGDHAKAAEGLQVLASLGPIDPADVHFRFTKHFHVLGRRSEARRQILRALEEAPRFRAAHRTLLDILADIEQNEGLEATKPSSDEQTETDT